MPTLPVPQEPFLKYVWESLFSLMVGSPSRLFFFRVLFEFAYLAAVWVFARRMRSTRYWEPPSVQPIDNLAKDELVI